MIEMTIRHSGGKSYRGHTPASVARRVFGRRAYVKLGETIADGPGRFATILLPPPARHRDREAASTVLAEVIITQEES